MSTVERARLLSQFTCLGDRCEDTCCQGWSMQVDEATHTRYQQQAPALLEAIEPAGENAWIMRKDPASGFCVKLEGGLCGIHKHLGSAFLSDACHFYPRVTRRLGEHILMTATMSCPEITRLALYGDHVTALEPFAVERLPYTLKNYLPEGTKEDDALLIHRAFLTAAECEDSAERIFLRAASASRSLERIDRANWPAMAAYYLAHADTRLPPAQPSPADPFNLLHALCGLVVTTGKPPAKRLQQTIADMEQALAATLDWQNIAIQADQASVAAYQRVHALWQEKGAAELAPVLRRWLQMQWSLSLYPYAGPGATLSERITIIGVRFATVKLALMCKYAICRNGLPQEEVVRILQSLSRFMDHLADAGFALQAYAEVGWNHEGRMRGLVEN